MNRKILIAFGAVCFLFMSAFTATMVVSGPYEDGSPEDPSFSHRMFYHQDEIIALDNYFTNVAPNLSVIDDYNTLTTEFSTTIFQQRQYMDENSITFEDIRDDPSILPMNFKLSVDQQNRINNVINSTLPVASPELEESLLVLQEYLGLAPQVDYSQLEMFDDGTGDDLSGKSNLGNSNGLQSKEAVRKLRDLLKTKVSSTAISIFPNPINETTKLSFSNPVAGDVKFTIYDVTGKVVEQRTKNLSVGEVILDYAELFQFGRDFEIMFLAIDLVDGNRMTTKFIIK